MRVSVVVFPGSNCDHDVAHVCGTVMRQTVSLVWHRERDLRRPDLVVIPGGFSFGDYLRTGALAKLSPVMEEVRAFADKGGPVIGVCNGFQILCEAGMLPGVLLQNADRKFLSRFVHLRCDNRRSPFTCSIAPEHVMHVPIAHGEGNYYADDDTLARLEGEGLVAFRYCRADGSVEPADRASNPNGSARAIAGIVNESGNVLGMMPHPERASEAAIGGIGGDSGKVLFGSIVDWQRERAAGV